MEGLISGWAYKQAYNRGGGGGLEAAVFGISSINSLKVACCTIFLKVFLDIHKLTKTIKGVRLLVGGA